MAWKRSEFEEQRDECLFLLRKQVLSAGNPSQYFKNILTELYLHSNDSVFQEYYKGCKFNFDGMSSDEIEGELLVFMKWFFFDFYTLLPALQKILRERKSRKSKKK